MVSLSSTHEPAKPWSHTTPTRTCMASLVQTGQERGGIYCPPRVRIRVQKGWPLSSQGETRLDVFLITTSALGLPTFHSGQAHASPCVLHIHSREMSRISSSSLLTQLANVLSSEALFYTCIIPFIIFFGSFAGLLYPMRDVLHPTGELQG